MRQGVEGRTRDGCILQEEGTKAGRAVQQVVHKEMTEEDMYRYLDLVGDRLGWRPKRVWQGKWKACIGEVNS